jgi:cephalosporin hydroxylase
MTHPADLPGGGVHPVDGDPPDLSIVVCAWNMARELPRTLATLAPGYQQGTGELRWEVVVVDNGSDPPLHQAALARVMPGVRLIRADNPALSPARALNAAVAATRGRLVGLWIDGARMASPGIVARAAQAWRADPGRAIGTLAFHLGADVQMRSQEDGYDQAAEDALLKSVPWRTDGYRLFDIAVLAGSSRGGWWDCIAETNALFADRALWDRLGGLDERFASPGGGFVNMDLWDRAVAASGGSPWIILGEATFHQVHGGAATGGSPQDRKAMADEYARLAGRRFATPQYAPRYAGALDAVRFAAGTPAPVESARQVAAVRGRRFRVDLPSRALSLIQAGTLAMRYKGLRLAKNPFDMALYLRALQALRPATIIEIGVSEGGSLVWLADQAHALGLQETGLIGIDLAPPVLGPGLVAGDRLHLLAGDATDPAGTFPHDLLARAPHPWLVIEDSAHSQECVSAVLDYLDRLTQPGDMIVVEDGVVADLVGAHYRSYQDGPNRAVTGFLRRSGARYAIATEYCDAYGANLTWAPNGWLRRQ